MIVLLNENPCCEECFSSRGCFIEILFLEVLEVYEAIEPEAIEILLARPLLSQQV